MSARSVSWIASLGIAVLAGLAGLLAGGVVATWCVDWYRISSFEGNSGYFVVFMAVFSGTGGFIVGLIVARAVAAAPTVNAFKALGFALVIVLAVAGGAAGTARLLADVPPEIDGETLPLLMELRWPAGQLPPTGAGSARLGSLSGSTLRADEVGPCFSTTPVSKVRSGSSPSGLRSLPIPPRGSAVERVATGYTGGPARHRHTGQLSLSRESS